MASTKNLVLLGLLIALVLLVSTQVGASSAQKTKPRQFGDVHEAQYGGGGYPGNGRGGGYPGRGGGRNGYPWRGCRYGCCRGYRNGRGCARCCATAREAPDALFQDDIKN
ncbi:glycine-rich protein-like [Lycium ferocissimum]|uniref:glycine-rich protein-like n=1 Tax=Lycium ferocissimum TaxID=112874 RepID=UPI0028159B6C|nr:glycine-rich protein-like [Lycium ferocissimum]